MIQWDNTNRLHTIKAVRTRALGHVTRGVDADRDRPGGNALLARGDKPDATGQLADFGRHLRRRVGARR